MDVAAASMSLSQASVMQQASISVMKKAMDSTESSMNAVLEMAPPSGHVLDVRA